MALFSSARQQQSSHLVEFRAGKMYTRGGGETGAKMTVYPDKRKGLVYIHQSEDGLMHFCWKDRTTGTVEDDLIVFPDDVEFESVQQCTTGRVFLLKFKNSSRKLFFWMQEPKTDKDEEHCRKVNELLNHPPAPGSGRAGRGGGSHDGMDQFSMLNQLMGLGGSGGGSGGEERMDLQNALAGMDQQQLMQLLNLMGTSTGGGGGGGFGIMPETGASATSSAPRRVSPPTAAQTATSTQAPNRGRATEAASVGGGSTAAAANLDDANVASGVRSPDTAQGIQVADLSSILAQIKPGSQAGQQSVQAIDLESVLTASNIEQAVRKPENEARLLAHLPEEQPIERTREELMHTIRSPQFRQAVDMFGTALQTGQLAPLMSQFGLPASAIDACARGDVQSVAEIMEMESGAGTSSGNAAAAGKDKEKKEKEKGKEDDGKSLEPPAKKDKPDQEGMDLD